jgi:type II restriction enzyme
MSPTAKQSLGNQGEELIARKVRCPGCKRSERTLRRLPPNFKCADVICDFCGYLAQVKTKSLRGALPEECPSNIPGAAWGPQRARMEADIYFSLFIVVANDAGMMAIFFLPRDLQLPDMFVPRKPLGPSARRAGWQGFMIDFSRALGRPTRYSDGDVVEFRCNV